MSRQTNDLRGGIEQLVPLEQTNIDTRRAQLTVCAHATSREDATELLNMLGLLP